MIVQFNPNPTGGTNPDTMYLNMLRCITAIVTAPAGTSNIVVNPYTANNTINTGYNCIERVIANTEAGGWNISSRHTVPSSYNWPSANNTSQAYTPFSSQTSTSVDAFKYIADFYNASTKTATPYKKITFHTWSPYTGQYSITHGTSVNMPYINLLQTLGYATHLLVTYGSSTTPDWTDQSYVPGGTYTSTTNNVSSVASWGPTTSFNNSTQSKSVTWNALPGTASSSYYHPATGLWFDKPNTSYIVASTADYIIIWENYQGQSFSTGFNQSSRYPYQSTYYMSSYGSIYYFGTRDTQPWENLYNNNVPWVGWNFIPQAQSQDVATAPNPNHIIAINMMTLGQTFALKETTPKIYALYDKASEPSCWLPWTNPYNQNTQTGSYDSTSVTSGYPIYYNTSSWGYLDPAPFNAISNGTSTAASYWPRTAFSGLINPPVMDPTSGSWVLPAYPITIKKSYIGRWNQSGPCKGIYKSLSSNQWANFTSKIWVSEGQLFTVNGENYMPVQQGTETFLVRFA